MKRRAARIAIGSALMAAAFAQANGGDGRVDPTFEKWCAHCHREGIYMAGTAGLEAKYKGAVPALLERRTDLTVEVVKNFVRHGSNSMAPFRKTEISDAELDALARYLAKADKR